MAAVIEDAKEIVIDKWGTLNTAASPQKLPDSHSPNNNNVWMDEKPGSVVTANGYQKLGEIPSGNPPTLLLNFFKTSDGSSQLVVSDNESVWHTTNYVDYTLIKSGLAQAFQLRGKVIRDKLWLTNGSDSVMTWDGTTLVELDGSGSLPNVPLGKYIEYHDERIWLFGINGDLSSLRFTALTDSTGTEITPDDADAWPSDNEIQVSEGDADQGTGIFLYRGYLYCSKQFSIWRITGYDEYTYTRVKTRASTGTRFQESIQIKDNLVHLIGVDGFYVFDGEEAKRISDIIDPASADEGVFAFRNLQQPLLNSQFWNVTDAAAFNAGTVPNNLSTTSDRLSLAPADDTQSDFQSGTHDDTTADDNPGNLQLALASSGSGALVSSGKAGMIYGEGHSSEQVVGSPSSITDGNVGVQCGMRKTQNQVQTDHHWEIDLASSVPIGRIVIRNFFLSASTGMNGALRAEGSNDRVSWTQLGATIQGAVVGVGFGPTTFDHSFSTVSFRYVRLVAPDVIDRVAEFPVPADNGMSTITEMEVYRAGFEADGKFISASIDFGVVPASFGALAAAITLNGETAQFFTQSSDDGSTWDAEANLANGAAITSTLRRYLRWGVSLNSSNGISSPVIDKVFVGGTYVSEIHDTGGMILQWSALAAAITKAGQTVNLYYRAASTAGGVSSASWVAIVPGAVPNTAITNTFIQVRIEMSTANAEQVPFVDSFTVHWILTSASGAAVLQNVASFIWLNRYWLAAATLGATENDVIIVLGKSTFGSPWHKKDFKFLSFCRFQDIFIGGSSEDGSLYHLETGFSKDGAAMDCYYETRDLGLDGFVMKIYELLVTLDRSGSYDLSVGWSVDGGVTWNEKLIDLTRDSGESLSMTKRINITQMSDTIRFRVRINEADQPFSVDEIKMYARQIAQRGEIAA